MLNDCTSQSTKKFKQTLWHRLRSIKMRTVRTVCVYLPRCVARTEMLGIREVLIKGSFLLCDTSALGQHTALLASVMRNERITLTL